MTRVINRLRGDIEEAILNDRFPMQLLNLYTNRDFFLFNVDESYIIEKLTRRATIKGGRLNFHYIEDSVYRFNFKFIRRTIKGVMYILKDEGSLMFLLLKDDHESYSPEDLKRIARKLYPLTYAPIIPYRELIDIVDDVSNRNTVIVKQYLLRQHIAKKEKYNKLTPNQTMKQWTEKNYRDARDEIIEDSRRKKSVLDALLLKIFDGHDFYANIRLDRFGIISIYYSTPNLYDRLLKYLMEKYIEKSYIYYNKIREVKIEEKEKVSEVNAGILEFEYAIKPEDFDVIINNLRTSFYVIPFYVGNPWMNIEVVDIEDGSIFKIIVNEKKIIVIPDYNARPSSLQLLIEAINSVSPVNFKEITKEAIEIGGM